MKHLMSTEDEGRPGGPTEMNSSSEFGGLPSPVQTSARVLRIHEIIRQFEAVRHSDSNNFGALAERERRRMVADLLNYAPIAYTEQLSPELVAAHDPHSLRARTLRYLAGRLIGGAATGEGLCFSVAAPHRRAGATFLVANLAIVYSQIGMRTVLVDANFRAPRLHKLFGCSLESRKSIPQDDVLNSSLPIPLKRLRPFNNLSLVPAAERKMRKGNVRITSAFDEVVRALRRSYDVVICDAPAYAGGRGSDCEVVAGICGDAVMVLRRDHTPLRRARALLSSLESARVNVLGSTLMNF